MVFCWLISTGTAAHQPQLLVLDEPTVGLDIESRAAIWALLRELRESGTTILITSHYLEEIDALADRMAIIDRNILRLGISELLFDSITPPKVVINEAIEIAKKFGTDESPDFINGILDKVLKDSKVVP